MKIGLYMNESLYYNVIIFAVPIYGSANVSLNNEANLQERHHTILCTQ